LTGIPFSSITEITISTLPPGLERMSRIAKEILSCPRAKPQQVRRMRMAWNPMGFILIQSTP
jgi:hypothetical protein